MVLKWHRVDDERRARLLGQAMPENAMVCETCYQLINKGGWGRPEGGDDPATLRARALGMILGVPLEVRAAAAAGGGGDGDDDGVGALHARMAWFFQPMPDAVLAAFGAWSVLRFWLGDDEHGNVARENADVWLLNGHTVGGRVSYRHGMAQLLPGFCQLLFEFAGSVSQAIEHIETFDDFWAAVGSRFNALLVSTINGADGRLAQIKAGSLSVLTPWVDDWWTLPVGLRDFMSEAVAGARERLVWKSALHRSHVEQKWRATYTALQVLMHAMNPAANEPLHTALHRAAEYNGGTTEFRMILSRLGIVIEKTLAGRKQDVVAANADPAR
eukprot:SAG22_NODE_4803_length_1160_cov_1.089538_1_plen_328_part_01